MMRLAAGIERFAERHGASMARQFLTSEGPVRTRITRTRITGANRERASKRTPTATHE
jgi:hypothetical protein